MSLIKSTKASLVSISFLFDCVYIFFHLLYTNQGAVSLSDLNSMSIGNLNYYCILVYELLTKITPIKSLWNRILVSCKVHCYEIGDLKFAYVQIDVYYNNWF